MKATSLAVNGLPSLHLTPERIGTVSVLPPLDQAGWPEASIGTGGWVGFITLKM